MSVCRFPPAGRAASTAAPIVSLLVITVAGGLATLGFWLLPSVVFAQPGNDNFADRAAIASLPYTASLDTSGATTEVGEPQPCGIIGSTVWYSYTPSDDETLQAYTTWSGYDTVLAVYTGTTLENLISVACDDDSGPELNSLITFTATAGTTYHFQVGGFAGSSGDLHLSLAPLVPPTPTITPCPPSSCTPTPPPPPTPTSVRPIPKPDIDVTVNGQQGPITVAPGDSVTYRWVVTNLGDGMFRAIVENWPDDALNLECSWVNPGYTCENSAQVTLLTPGPVKELSRVTACGIPPWPDHCEGGFDDDTVTVNVVAPASTSTPTGGPPVGGIAQLPVPAAASAEETGAGTEGSGWSSGSVAALAGGLAIAVLAFAAGAWYARRRWRVG